MDKKRLARILILTALILIAFWLWTRRKTITALAAGLPIGGRPGQIPGQVPGQPPQVSLSLEGQLGFPECIGSYDKIPDGEERVTFSVSTGTITSVFQNTRDHDIEVLEVLIECVGANTFQLSKTGLLLTPVWDFIARQVYSDPGFILRKGEEIFVNPSSTAAVIGYVRFRERGTVLCSTPPTILTSPPVGPVTPVSPLLSAQEPQPEPFACPGEIVHIGGRTLCTF